ncbi:hypothetical protein HY772_07280 [Candidatus Woesearchaeota archaeon]|nr:hypothetical protein [Candidatus Woesearchaeota archaeon]
MLDREDVRVIKGRIENPVHWLSPARAERPTNHCIEEVYNAKRLYSSIGYKTTNEMEVEVLNIT